MPFGFELRRRRSGRASLTRYTGDAVVASVQRFDLDKEADRAKLGKLQKEWQSDAWYYVDHVGELAYPYQFMSNCFRRVRVFAAWQRDPESDPIPVMDALRPETAAEVDSDLPAGVEISDLDEDAFIPPNVAEICRDVIDLGFVSRDGGQEALMERFGGNLFLVGEALLVRRAVMTRRPAEGETLDDVPRVMDWEVRSADEVVNDTSAGIMRVRDEPDTQLDRLPPIEGDGTEQPFVERVWQKHGRWSGWAHSNVRAAMGVLDELDLLAKLARVAIRSRILAGVITMPDEMEFPASEQPPGDDSPRRSVRFDREMAEALASAIGNEADANTVAPLMLRGPKDLLGSESVRIMEFPRRYGQEERAQYEEAVTRLARTLDLPVEVVKGMADANHWTAWQIEDSTYEAHVEPHVMIAVEGLTYSLLRPVLRELGVDESIVERCVVAADPSRLIRRPDRGKTATEGYNLMALSWDAWRRANGFADDDAPSSDELVMRLAVQRSILTADLSAILLEQSGLLEPGAYEAMQREKAEIEQDAQQPAPVDAEPSDESGVDDEPTPTEEGEPSDEAVAAAAQLAALLGRDARDVAAVVAAAKRTSVGFALSTADRVLRERLQAEADAAARRALERAGNRLRNRARADATVSAALKAAGTTKASDVGRVLGAAVIAAVGLDDDDLFGDSFDELRARYDEWVGATQAAALAAVAAVAGDSFTDERRRELEREQEEDRGDGWVVFLAALLAFARARFVGDDVTDGEQGEFDPTAIVPAAVVREALAVAGGETVEHGLDGALVNALDDSPLGGPSTGRLIRVTLGDLGFPTTGYTWVYGLAPRQTSFEPHAALDGQSFATWTDDVLTNGGDWPRTSHFYPGDHRYCRCDFAPLIGSAALASAYPANGQEV